MSESNQSRCAAQAPVTGETIALWESELNDFIVDIQAKLEPFIAPRVELNEPTAEQNKNRRRAVDDSFDSRQPNLSPSDRLPAAPSTEDFRSIPQMVDIAPIDSNPNGANSLPSQVAASSDRDLMDPSPPPSRETTSPIDETSDRIQAIKQRIAERLQEASTS